MSTHFLFLRTEICTLVLPQQYTVNPLYNEMVGRREDLSKRVSRHWENLRKPILVTPDAFYP
jgi:hypothetical protein